MFQFNVLVIDDDVELREFLQDFLIGEGYSVEILGDSTKTLEVLEQGQFHLIILDLAMPKICGLQVLAQVRQVDTDVAIIILTGEPSLESATSAIELDVSAYIRKPFVPEEFREALDRIAKKKGLHLNREEELHSIIGQNIRELRKQHGLTLKQLARRSELSVSLLSQVERAKASPSVSTLFRVAMALDTPISNLFEGYRSET